MRKGSSGSIELYALQIQCISFRYRSKELNVILWPAYASAQFFMVYRGFLLYDQINNSVTVRKLADCRFITNLRAASRTSAASPARTHAMDPARCGLYFCLNPF